MSGSFTLNKIKILITSTEYNYSATILSSPYYKSLESASQYIFEHYLNRNGLITKNKWNEFIELMNNIKINGFNANISNHPMKLKYTGLLTDGHRRLAILCYLYGPHIKVLFEQGKIIGISPSNPPLISREKEKSKLLSPPSPTSFKLFEHPSAPPNLKSLFSLLPPPIPEDYILTHKSFPLPRNYSTNTDTQTIPAHIIDLVTKSISSSSTTSQSTTSKPNHSSSTVETPATPVNSSSPLKSSSFQPSRSILKTSYSSLIPKFTSTPLMDLKL